MSDKYVMQLTICVFTFRNNGSAPGTTWFRPTITMTNL